MGLLHFDATTYLEGRGGEAREAREDGGRRAEDGGQSTSGVRFFSSSESRRPYWISNTFFHFPISTRRGALGLP